MGVEKLDHYSVRTADLERATRFYENALGLRQGPRPPFRFGGAWLYAGDHPVVHLIGTDAGAPGKDTGAFDHIAFAATGIAEMHARLEQHGVAYRERKVPDRELHQVFVHDPDGVTIELNYSEPDDIAAGDANMARAGSAKP